MSTDKPETKAHQDKRAGISIGTVAINKGSRKLGSRISYSYSVSLSGTHY